MGIIKSVSKHLLYISIILTIGQIPLGSTSLGGQFLTSVGDGTRWVGTSLISAKFMAGVPIPEFLTKWLNQEAETPKKKRQSKIEILSEEQISKNDREAMLQLLKE